MGRLSLTTQDYIDTALEKGLTFTGKTAPYSVYDKTWWVCNNPGCRKEHYKTYRAVYLKDVGCICQTKMTLSDDNYRELAEKLGIEWVGARPPNVATSTEWKTKSGKILSMPYSKLAYRPSKKTLTLLEIEDVERLNSSGTGTDGTSETTSPAAPASQHNGLQLVTGTPTGVVSAS